MWLFTSSMKVLYAVKVISMKACFVCIDLSESNFYNHAICPVSMSIKVLYPRGLDPRHFLTNDTCEQKMFQLKSYSFCKISLLPIVYFCL